jgi:hypothetical protein
VLDLHKKIWYNNYTKEKEKVNNMYSMIIDTETISINKPFIYDIGAIVFDKDYKVVEYHHFILSQVYDNKMLFSTAYYHDKRKEYTKRLQGRTAKKTHVGHAFRTIRSIIDTYEIENVYAYNAPFDKRAFEFTANFFELKNPLRDMEFIDIQMLANHNIHKTSEYKKFAKENNGITEKGFYKVNAELTGAYLLQVPYQENHIGLDDCFIELEILKACKDQTPFERLYMRAD